MDTTHTTAGPRPTPRQPGTGSNFMFIAGGVIVVGLLLTMIIGLIVDA